jgi:hypothetical protein
MKCIERSTSKNKSVLIRPRVTSTRRRWRNSRPLRYEFLYNDRRQNATSRFGNMIMFYNQQCLSRWLYEWFSHFSSICIQMIPYYYNLLDDRGMCNVWRFILSCNQSNVATFRAIALYHPSKDHDCVRAENGCIVWDELTTLSSIRKVKLEVDILFKESPIMSRILQQTTLIK